MDRRPTTMTIYKYEFNIRRKVEFYTHKVHEILHFGTQRPGHGVLCMWALVDPDIGHEAQRFYVIGTGQPMPDGKDLEHLATVQDGSFVWHIFKERKE